MNYKEVLKFYKGKRVLVTGHTGFKGSWLIRILVNAGAIVTGYSLEPPTTPSLFELAKLENNIHSVIGDIRDRDKLSKVFDEGNFDIVFHLAAQPIVRKSYKEPVLTYETNVMGTVNICEAVRQHMFNEHNPENGGVRSFLNVTTDKVYKNNEWCWGYREDEPLDGFDPYSNSKSCSELITHSYINSFYGCNKNSAPIGVSTARAGNVIGGGDFAEDRIIPDCVRSVKSSSTMIVRNPESVRPYQHVLEPLFLYLTIAYKQYGDHSYSGYYNIGPDETDCITTGELVNLFSKYFNNSKNAVIFKAKFGCINNNNLHEANYLKLDTSLVKSKFGWNPTWHIDEAINKVVEWTKVYLDENASSEDILKEMDREISQFVE